MKKGVLPQRHKGHYWKNQENQKPRKPKTKNQKPKTKKTKGRQFFLSFVMFVVRNYMINNYTMKLWRMVSITAGTKGNNSVIGGI
jgi:hypothetical protein